MGTDISEVTEIILSLLPVILILIVSRWIFKVFGGMGGGWSSHSWRRTRSSYYDDEENESEEEPEPIKQVINEVQVKCESCGADNEELDAFCGYCGSMLYQNETVKVRPMIIES